MNSEFVSSPRTDNQVHCFSATEALIAHANNADILAADSDISMIGATRAALCLLDMGNLSGHPFP
jgi:aspartyl aminopeptidase